MQKIKICVNGSHEWKKALRSICVSKSVTTKQINSQKYANFLGKCNYGNMYYGNHQGQIILEAKN